MGGSIDFLLDSRLDLSDVDRGAVFGEKLLALDAVELDGLIQELVLEDILVHRSPFNAESHQQLK